MLQTELAKRLTTKRFRMIQNSSAFEEIQVTIEVVAWLWDLFDPVICSLDCLYMENFELQKWADVMLVLFNKDSELHM